MFVLRVYVIKKQRSLIKFNTKFIFAGNGQKRKKKEGYQKKVTS